MTLRRFGGQGYHMYDSQVLLAVVWLSCVLAGLSAGAEERPNVLFIISDDLTATALSCYENKACQTPHIDRLAAEGMRYTRAFCQFPVCGPSRASLMSGYYPHATRVFGYTSGREGIGDRATWSQHFMNAGYYSARVSKIFHMGVPGDIQKGNNGADDKRSWTERFNSQGPEVFAAGESELLEGNPGGSKPVRGGNTLEYCKADGDDLVHADGKTAAKACELIREHKQRDTPFFLAVGFVRPHVPFAAPRAYFEPFPFQDVRLPERVANDWDDIPKAGINYRTSKGMQLSKEQEQKAIATYYATVSFMDEQVGKVMHTLREEGLDDTTIVIFTSDHGFHLGEHEFWMKVGLMDESSRVPLIIKVPGEKPGVCHSFVELLDLYPTISELCGLEVPDRLQGHSLTQTLRDPMHSVRDAAFCVNGRGFLLRTDRWAYIQHGEDASLGSQLYDMKEDPKQFTNLVSDPDYAGTVGAFKERLRQKLESVRTNDLGDMVKQEKTVTTSPGKNDRNLRVVSYNIKHGQGMDGKVDIERIARVLAEQKPDLIALQEVDNNCTRSGNRDLAADVGKALGMEHHFAKAMDVQGGEYGVAVLSRFPITDSRLHPLPGEGEPRTALEVVVEAYEQKLSFVSLHLEWRTEETRSQQVEALVHALNSRTHPVILAGDFNAPRDGAPMQYLANNGWDVLVKNDGQGSRTMQGEKHRPESPTAARAEIDFVVLRGFPKMITTHGVIQETMASDHRPIYADLAPEP